MDELSHSLLPPPLAMMWKDLTGAIIPLMSALVRDLQNALYM
jgi:hypothetical protein